MKPEQIGLYTGVTVLLVGIFLIDIWLALGFTPWLLYIIPLGLTYWAAHLSAPLVVTALCTALIFIGYELSPPLVPHDVALANRFFGAATFWVLGILISGYKLLGARLAKLNDELRGELMERTKDLGRAVRVLRVVSEQESTPSYQRSGVETEFARQVTDVFAAESRRLQQKVLYLVKEERPVAQGEVDLEESRRELEQLGKQLEQLQRDLLHP
ncbi:hypothetical protein [Petrachloros mirabilis]